MILSLIKSIYKILYLFVIIKNVEFNLAVDIEDWIIELH